MSVKTAVVVMMAAVIGIFLGGCGSAGMGRYDVVLSMDQALVNQPGGPPNVTVDLVAVSDPELAQWSSKSVTDYWKPGDATRADASAYAKSFTFGPGNTGPFTLSKNDPIWDTWTKQKRQYLMILANLPGGHADMPGEADTRRKILPLTTDRWESDQKIRVMVQRATLQVETPPKPLEAKK